MSVLEANETGQNQSNVVGQALWFFTHSFLALIVWVGMMMAITVLVRPTYLPPIITLAISAFIPFLAGFILNKFRQDEIATLVWLLGLIWFLCVGLWILDMPTGPNQCFRCDATQKLWLTFFSLSEDSGMIDGQGRLFGTWPAAALIGYSIGAKMGLNKQVEED
jgi:hypothetical protein